MGGVVDGLSFVDITLFSIVNFFAVRFRGLFGGGEMPLDDRRSFYHRRMRDETAFVARGERPGNGGRGFTRHDAAKYGK